jgi:hypothetical protein
MFATSLIKLSGAKLLARQVAFCPTYSGANPRMHSRPTLKPGSDELPTREQGRGIGGEREIIVCLVSIKALNGHQPPFFGLAYLAYPCPPPR